MDNARPEHHQNTIMSPYPLGGSAEEAADPAAPHRPGVESGGVAITAGASGATGGGSGTGSGSEQNTTTPGQTDVEKGAGAGTEQRKSPPGSGSGEELRGDDGNADPSGSPGPGSAQQRPPSDS